jgi:hypothetical protein
MNRRSIGAALTVAALAGVALAAPAHAVPDRTAAVTAAHDWDGDGLGDLAALTSDGRLLVYRGAGTRFAGPPQLVASGLRGFQSAQLAGDVDEDGATDILARGPGGALWLLRGAEGGAFAGLVRIAGDWSSYEDVVPIDVNVDGIVDLLAHDRDEVPGSGTSNVLRLYAGEAGTTFRASTFFPLGDQRFDQLTVWGDGDDDGYQEIVVRDLSTGRLLALETRGTWSLFQHKAQHRLLGTGWNSFTTILSTGDFDADGDPDLVGRTQAGTLLLYRSDAEGRLGRPSVVGTGWGALRIS